MLRKRVSCVLLTLGSSIATSASAQTAEGGIEDIIVTATRREEGLQKIPVTVTAITGENLRASGVLETRELTQLVPGLVGSRNSGVNQPVIRGVGSSGVVGDEANVATYIDGVYQPDPFMTNLDLVKIARIEVLRGPQGTLFGRNATGGLINVITPDPSQNFGGFVAASYSRLRGASDYDLRAYLTGGLSPTLAMDFSALYKGTGDYITDLTTGRRDLGASDYYAFRSKLLFTPSDWVRMVLTGEYAKRTGQSNTLELFERNSKGGLYPGVILPTGPWQASLNYAPRLNTEKYNVSLQTGFDLGALKLETTSAYQAGKWVLYQDLDSSNINLGLSDNFAQQDAFSQEVRLLSNRSGSLRWLVGGYYYWSEINGDLAVFGPAVALPPPALPTLIRRGFLPTASVSSFAGFGEGTYELTDTLSLTLGARYTTETRKFVQVSRGAPLFPQQSATFDKFTYRAALAWQFDPHANFYLSYGTGFKSGIFNPIGASPLPTRPENLKAVEGGIKADPTRWLRANLSVFHYDYTDLQVTARDPATSQYLLQNAANARVYGGELEVTIAPTADINLRANAAYAHGRYRNFPLAQAFVPNAGGGNTAVVADASGKVMVRTPKLTFNIGADWNHVFDFGRIGASANFYHSSRVYYDFVNNFSMDAYSMLNAEVFFSPPGDHLRFSVSGTNLTNTDRLQYLRIGAESVDGIREKPRTIRFTARYDF